MNELPDREEFVHFRAINQETGKLLSKGGATVYYNPVKPGVIAVGVALCSFKDNFNRKIGRRISSGRSKQLLSSKPVDREELIKRATNTVEEAIAQLSGRLQVPAGTALAIYRRAKKKKAAKK